MEIHDVTVLYGEASQQAIDADLDLATLFCLKKDEELRLLRVAVESLAESLAEIAAMKSQGQIIAGSLLAAADRLAADIGSAFVAAVPAAAEKNR